MIHIVMKDGRVIRYNDCRFYSIEDKWLRLDVIENGTHIGRINADLVERIEYVKPCAITRPTKQKPTRY